MRTQAISFTALVCAAVCTACSQQTIEQKLDAYFDALDGHFMGSVVVRQDGKTVYQRSMGWADVENQIPATAETQYRIGSISKTFTAVLVMKAAAEGRLSLNDPVAKYFPDAQIPNADQITIDQLLQHRSGLVDIVSDRPYEYLTYYTTPQTRRQILERVAAAGTTFSLAASTATATPATTCWATFWKMCGENRTLKLSMSRLSVCWICGIHASARPLIRNAATPAHIRCSTIGRFSRNRCVGGHWRRRVGFDARGHCKIWRGLGWRCLRQRHL
jgi:Beta-lactamase class C and other penicillin binding proteins